MGKRNNPGCRNCCEDEGGLDPECYFTIDDFNRPDSTNIGAALTEQSGVWEILAQVLHGSGTVISTAANPTGPAMHVSVNVKGSTSVTVLLASDATASSYVAVTLTFGASGTLAISQVGGSGDTESVALVTEPDTWYTLTTCYNGSFAKASVAGTNVSALLGDVTGDRVGLRATMTSEFDDLFAAEVGETCAACTGGDIDTTGCVFCAGGVVAEYYQVEISGMAEFANCDDCESLDGVYIVGPVQQTSVGGDPFDCSDAMLLATVCGASDEPGCYGLLALQFYQSLGAYRVLVTLRTGGTPCGQGGGQPTIEWEKSFGATAPDCLFRDGFGIPQPESLPWVTNGVPTTERCDGSAATCTITAIPAP
jgi:hypothetical protein